MNKYPKIGDPVEVTCYIDRDLEDDKIGEVYHRNGDYIYVRLDKSGILVECYINELKEITPP